MGGEDKQTGFSKRPANQEQKLNLKVLMKLERLKKRLAKTRMVKLEIFQSQELVCHLDLEGLDLKEWLVGTTQSEKVLQLQE